MEQPGAGVGTRVGNLVTAQLETKTHRLKSHGSDSVENGLTSPVSFSKDFSY